MGHTTETYARSLSFHVSILKAIGYNSLKTVAFMCRGGIRRAGVLLVESFQDVGRVLKTGQLPLMVAFYEGVCRALGSLPSYHADPNTEGSPLENEVWTR